MKIDELLKEGKIKLTENKIEDANLIARVLLEFILKIDRNELIKKQLQEIEKENAESI